VADVSIGRGVLANGEGELDAMTKAITLEVSHPDGKAGLIEGFRFLWAYYVDGFDHHTHCQDCFKGELVEEFKTGVASTGTVVFDQIGRHKYVYVCGVGLGPVDQLRTKNFHLPLRYEESSSVTKRTYNGYIVTARNAAELTIPALPERWNGLDSETTRCKNFQFAVEYFGYPSSRASAPVRSPQ
jgi:hypothetical protein